MAQTPPDTTRKRLPPLPNLIFASRWLQLPLYLGLILAQAVYVFHFWVELVHLIEAAFGDKVALAKLVVHPLLVLGVGLGGVALGLPLDRSALVVMVLVAALPSASNVSMLAERFGADTGRIARIILVTTAAAFLTFSGAVALLT